MIPAAADMDLEKTTKIPLNRTENTTSYYDGYYPYYYDGNMSNYSSYLSAQCAVDWTVMVASTPSYGLFMHILLPIVCSIGIVGIILTVHVLSRKTMSTSTNCYLISLATSDLVVLMIMSVQSFETGLSREGHYYYILLMTYFFVILYIFLLASVWLTVMLAVERYIAICHPLRAMSICTVARARAIIVLIFIVSTLSRIPDLLKYKVTYFKDQCINKDVPYNEVTDLATNEDFRNITSWTDCVLLVILPFALLLFLNACLIREIHRSTNYLRYHLASDSNVQTIITGEEIKITLMLISVVVVFFICVAPYVVLLVLKRLNPDKKFQHFYLLNYITIALLVLRSSFNFVLYCWFSEKFWNTFKKTDCGAMCFFTRSPKWLRNQSDHVHSNSNRKISYFNTKDTTC